MMLPSSVVVDLSRLQFAFTALFHFLFVPLTLGLSWLLVAMETAYVLTGKVIYKDMTRFWGKLFAINFAIGVLTGVTLEFEFGTNWAYFSKLVGDVFGTALAIEGITAFMLEATFVGLFLVGWNRMGKWSHLLVTFLLALGSNLSVVNILVANSWMQHPVFTYFNYHTMHLHLTHLWGIYIDNIAQIRVGHVAMAGGLVASMFVMGISAFYLIKKRDITFATRSMAVAVGFGFIICLGSAFLGDQNGIVVKDLEPAKMAAIEGVWNTPLAPAAWSVIAFPSQSEEKNYFDILIPYGLSLIATHSLDGTIQGEKQIMAQNKVRIQHGWYAYDALTKMRQGDTDPSIYATFDKYQGDLGYGLLLQDSDAAMTAPTPTQLDSATKSSIPQVWVAFWSFRIMIACWIVMFLLISTGLYYTLRGTVVKQSWWLHLMLWLIPIPWIASEFGWITTEVGRQPWIVNSMLPTVLGTSSIDTSSVAFTLGGFMVLYFILFCIEIFLMFKYARLGPSSLGEKRYYFEKLDKKLIRHHLKKKGA